MNKFVLFLLNFLTVNILYVFDRSISGVFQIADYISLTITFLLFVINFTSFNFKILNIFYFGILINWYTKSFFGVLPLIFVILIFLYDLAKEKFAGNIISTAALNFLLAFIMYSSFYDFIFDIKLIIASLFSTLGILLVVLAKDLR